MKIVGINLKFICLFVLLPMIETKKIISMLKNILLLGLGGALGSVSRYLLTYMSELWAISGEWAILFANVLGSFLIGVLIVVSGGGTYLFAAVGFCGGFTTFSTFSAQALQLFQSGQRVIGFCYVLGSVALSLTAVSFGMYCGEKLFK